MSLSYVLYVGCRKWVEPIWMHHLLKLIAYSVNIS